MGDYTKRLFARKKAVQSGPVLIACYIKRDGEYHSLGFRNHYAIRAALGDESPKTSKEGDEEGFVTSDGRYLNRSEARLLGAKNGQCSAASRGLLSSDVNWDHGDEILSRQKGAQSPR
jgi:hypothetical protein